MAGPMNRTHFSLCSGIGGIDLAAHWANFTNTGFCEQDLFCQAVLRKNFGRDILIFDDVRALTAESLRERGAPWPFLVSAGFPCQDVSICGAQKGLGTETAPTNRSGLWFACLRFIRDSQPRYVLIENVRNLVHQGIDVILGGLGEAGYTCWAGIMGAEAVGAPHRRERVFIVGFNADCDGAEWDRGGCSSLADSVCQGRTSVGDGATHKECATNSIGASSNAAAGVAHFGDACGCRCSGIARRGTGAEPSDGHSRNACRSVADTNSARCIEQQRLVSVEAEHAALKCRCLQLADAEGGESDAGERRRLEQASGSRESADAAAGPCGYNGFLCHQLADAEGIRERESNDAPNALSAAKTAGQIPSRGSRWPAGPGQPQHEWEAPRTVPGTQSSLDLAADGLSRQLVRRDGRLRRLALKAAGNAVVPQQCYPVLAAIASHDEQYQKCGAAQ